MGEQLKRIGYLASVTSSLEGQSQLEAAGKGAGPNNGGRLEGGDPSSKQTQKFVEHFKRLFDVKTDDMLIIKLHQIYSTYHGMDSCLQVNPQAFMQQIKKERKGVWSEFRT